MGRWFLAPDAVRSRYDDLKARCGFFKRVAATSGSRLAETPIEEERKIVGEDIAYVQFKRPIGSLVSITCVAIDVDF